MSILCSKCKISVLVPAPHYSKWADQWLWLLQSKRFTMGLPWENHNDGSAPVQDTSLNSLKSHPSAANKDWMTANQSAGRWLIVLPAQPQGLKASKWCHTEPLIRRELADKSRTTLSYSRVPSCLPRCQHRQGQEIRGTSSSKISEKLTPLKLFHLTFEAPRLCVTQLFWERAEGPSLEGAGCMPPASGAGCVVNSWLGIHHWD